MDLDFRDTGAWGWKGVRGDPRDLVGFRLVGNGTDREASESLATFLELYDCAQNRIASSEYGQNTLFDLERTDDGVELELRGARVRTTFEELTTEVEAFLGETFAALDARGDTDHRQAGFRKLRAKTDLSFDVAELYDRLTED